MMGTYTSSTPQSIGTYTDHNSLIDNLFESLVVVVSNVLLFLLLLFVFLFAFFFTVMKIFWLYCCSIFSPFLHNRIWILTFSTQQFLTPSRSFFYLLPLSVLNFFNSYFSCWFLFLFLFFNSLFLYYYTISLDFTWFDLTWHIWLDLSLLKLIQIHLTWLALNWSI